MLQTVHVAHDCLRKVSQVPLAKVAERQLSEPLGQSDADCFDLAVDQAVCGTVLLQMSDDR